MAEGSQKKDNANGPESRESVGVLVGWTHSEFEGRIVLRVQSVRSSQHSGPEDVDSTYFYMTKNQALVLGNYLFQVSGQEIRHRRKRGWLGRLFGK